MIIAQLSDTHITVDGRQAADLEAALRWLNARMPRPHAIVLSGDTVNAGRAAEYERLRALLHASAIPVYVVPGNHDARAVMRGVLPDAHYPGVAGERMHYALSGTPVRIIALDSSETRRPGGVLDDAALRWFDATLAAQPATPAFVFLHHPPFRTGVRLADAFGFAGLRRFRAIVARHPHVRRIVAGHIHCERNAAIGQALATSSLSTTPQSVPELFERRMIGMRSEPAGFALHTWAHGRFSSTTMVSDGTGNFVERAVAVRAS